MDHLWSVEQKGKQQVPQGQQGSVGFCTQYLRKAKQGTHQLRSFPVDSFLAQWIKEIKKIKEIKEMQENEHPKKSFNSSDSLWFTHKKQSMGDFQKQNMENQSADEVEKSK